jgi:hypothetical protein
LHEFSQISGRVSVLVRSHPETIRLARGSTHRLAASPRSRCESQALPQGLALTYSGAVRRSLTIAFAVALALATLAPLFRDARQDSFPFSTYPMFARTIDKRWLLFAEGVGKRAPVRLGPELVANDEPMQAMRTLKLAAQQGGPALESLCARIAERVAASASLGPVRRVRIVQALFDPIAYFEVLAAPEQRKILQECRVPRHR